jgi:Leucine-rich repeat (LRR) protein
LNDDPLTFPQNLSTFSSLKTLSLQSNRITKLENLEDLVNLEELYLSHNGLKKIEGLEKNVSAGVTSTPEQEAVTCRLAISLPHLEDCLMVSGAPVVRASRCPR